MRGCVYVSSCSSIQACRVLTDRLVFRKGGMLLNTVAGVVAAALMGLSKLSSSFEMIIIGRLVVGYNCGTRALMGWVVCNARSVELS